VRFSVDYMVFSKRWAWGARVGSLVISAVLVWGITRIVKLSAITGAFATMRPEWFLAAVLMYGLVLLPASVRWHLVLKISRAAISPSVTLRYTLIGHFFYTVLFGVIGGDAVKASLYARHFKIPFPRLLATAPLDRALGLMTSIIVGSVLVLAGIPHMKLELPQWYWLIAIPLAMVAGCLVICRSRLAPPCSAFLNSLRNTARMFVALPGLIILGMCCSLLSQVALSAVLALNLRAVTHSPLPWSQLLWTFPIIIAVSALPISVGGLGTREAAAVVLLSSYGISSGEATSASLLSLAVTLIWAGTGAILTPETRSWPRRVIRWFRGWVGEPEKEIYSLPQTD
jgi:uncharacterized membrane protein YbhN (UPF0104 family)